MTTYTSVFGGPPQNPSQIFLISLTLSADVELSWPWSPGDSTDLLAKIMQVTTSGAGHTITLPPAAQASNGEATMFINTGANSFDVDDSEGGNITTVASGTVKFVYLIDNSNESWGVFTFGTGTSAADAASLAGAGLLALSGTLNGQITTVDVSSTGYNLTSASRAVLYNWTSGAGAFTTDDPSTLGTGWFACLKNSGSGSITITPAAGVIDGAASKTLNPTDSCFIIRDGANLISLGFGQAVAFAFDYIAINVAGTGNFTLNSSQQNRISYKFTGLLTGNRHIIVPATVQQYWVDNSTTGAFTLDVGVAAQPSPVAIAANARDILYCNGSEVVDAVTGGISVPVAIADGGTGATTASGARTNLGATSVGNAVFTAASAGAAAAAIGAAVTDANNNFTTNQTLVSTDAGATALPVLDLYRNSASPAASDFIGAMTFTGKDSGGNDTVYAQQTAQIVTVTNGSEDGALIWSIMKGGALSEAAALKMISGATYLQLTDTDPGNVYAPILRLYRNSVSPAASDQIGLVSYLGNDSGGNQTAYASIGASIIDPTDGSEDSRLHFSTVISGAAQTTKAYIGAGLYTAGVAGGDKGADTINTVSYYIGGVQMAMPVLQVVNTQTGAVATGTTTMPYDDTIPQNTEGTEFMSVTITPRSSGTKLRIDVVAFVTLSSAATVAVGGLFQDSIANAIAAASQELSVAGEQQCLTFTHYMTSGTASATTFKFRAGPSSAATMTFNGTGGNRRLGGVMASSITITEYYS